MHLGNSDLQERVLRTFTVLHSLRADWGGALIICCGLGPQGAALALASNIAGAVCLCVEQDPNTLKQAMRSGSCDFIVTTLDEALRAMKNEVRKHLPLSVGLQGNPVDVLQELIERGVSPELFTDLSGEPVHQEPMQRFRSLGAVIVHFDSAGLAEGEVDADANVEAYVQQRQWSLQSFSPATPEALRTFDALALSLVSADDSLRSRWLQSVPRILQRERPIRRVLWVTQREEQILRTHLSTAV